MNDESYDQTPEELQAQYAAGGAVDTAFRFVRATLGDLDFAAGWDLTCRDLRTARAQAWLWNNRGTISGDLEHHAAQLVGPAHRQSRLWRSFAETELAQLVVAWGEAYAGDLGAASRPRPVGVDLELVLLVPTHGTPTKASGPTWIQVDIMLLMCFEDGVWKVAAYCDRLPELGWPPTF